MKNKGLLLVISGPSGCGKGTVCKELLQKNDDYVISVSATTRNMRPGEIDGESYFFITKEEFEEMIKNGEFLEYNCGYSGSYYGTPKKYVLDMLEQGKNVILEIEMNGAENVKKVYPEGILIFLAPPSLEELKKRLVGRGSESEEQINERFSAAKDEIKRVYNYQYIVVNDNLDDAVEQVNNIVSAEKASVARNEKLINELIK